MFISVGTFRKLLLRLTVAATLVLALLPAGKLPRVAGPCGQALCLCSPPPRVEVPPCCESCEPALKSAPSPRCVTFSIENSLQSHAVSLLKCLDAALAAKMPEIFCIDVEHDRLPQTCLFVVSGSPAEVSVPPPRA